MSLTSKIGVLKIPFAYYQFLKDQLGNLFLNML